MVCTHEELQLATSSSSKYCHQAALQEIAQNHKIVNKKNCTLATKKIFALEPRGHCTLSPWTGFVHGKLNLLWKKAFSLISHPLFWVFGLCRLWMKSYIKNKKNQNYSPKRQLKFEPSTVIIHAQIDEIYHFKGQKTWSRLGFFEGKGIYGCLMKSYNNKEWTESVLLNVS